MAFSTALWKFSRASLVLTLFFNVVSVKGQESGESPPLLRNRIVNGREAPRGRFPYMCSLRRNGNRDHVCGAILVDEEWVLTAAHCVDPTAFNSAGLSPAIHCGIHEVDEDDPTKTFFSEQACLHSSWNGMSSDGFDLALMRLDRTASSSKPRLNQRSNPIGTRVDIAAIGWGVLESGSNRPATELQLVSRLRVHPGDACDMDWPQITINPDTMICTAPGTEDTCEGDSGGPLLLLDTKGGGIETGDPRADLIVGLTSFGSSECGDGKTPAVYTNVGYFRSWITDVISGKIDECRVLSTSSPSPPQSLSPSANELFSRATVTRLRRRMEILEALEDDDADTVASILALGFDPDAVINDRSIREPADDTPLHWAVYFDAEMSARVLIENGANIESRNRFSDTPLHDAAFLNSPGVARILIENGAEVDARGNEGSTPLMQAADGSIIVVEILLEFGADLAKVDDFEETALHKAAIQNRRAIIRVLISNGADVDSQRDDGYTALHFSAMYGDLSAVRILTAAGANVDIKNNADETPLMEAVITNHPEVVQVLVDSGADLDDVNRLGLTALHEAAGRGLILIIEILLEAGASKTIISDDGDRPIDYVCTVTDSPCTRTTTNMAIDLLSV